jgi:hypothetical protein
LPHLQYCFPSQQDTLDYTLKVLTGQLVEDMDAWLLPALQIFACLEKWRALGSVACLTQCKLTTRQEVIC